MTKRRRIQLIAAIIILVFLVLLLGFLLPRSLDKAMWHYRTDIKHIGILRYDQNQLPATWITLDTERSGGFLEGLSRLHCRYAGPYGAETDEADPEGYALRLTSTDYDEIDLPGDFRFVMADREGTLTVSWGENKKATYRLGSDRQTFFDLCDSYLDPEDGYPGRAFLEEFFTVGKDRWKIWETALFSSYSGAMAEVIEPYHEGLAPYVTAEILKRIELGRYLSRMELSCMAEARNWEILMIRIDEKSISGSYNFWVDLASTEEPRAYKTFSGSYVVNKDGRISNFFVDLSE